jgi:hypothetical protein
VTGKPVPDPGFAGDDGAPDPRLAEALASGQLRAVQEALVAARVFVPLLAILGEAEAGADGLPREKSSDIAVVTVRRPDGALALPVFTSTDALAAWDPAARPLPVEGPRAALAAYAEGAVALLLDPGSTAGAVLYGSMLVALAEARRWLPPAEDPEVAAAVSAYVPPGVRWSLRPSEVADASLVLTFPEGTSRAVAGEAAQTLAGALAGVDLLRARLSDGLDVVVQLDRPSV